MVEDTEIAIKEHQQDCASEILAAIKNLNRNIDAVPKQDNGESNKDKDSNNKAALEQEAYVTECQSKYTMVLSKVMTCLAIFDS
ncbi:hypothetical protein DPMN_037119 [Dreissena polymorpha]|uniref:Uncharacterized protein n=1 Tax=Dreissena polymorpha TaxID=45954 RepID=A0A9D4MDW3_DREPO|nr:hypothetical protein DPMN_037119 [Dreissena polymorpha]